MLKLFSDQKSIIVILVFVVTTVALFLAKLDSSSYTDILMVLLGAFGVVNAAEHISVGMQSRNTRTTTSEEPKSE